jgi:hypothetical protein
MGLLSCTIGGVAVLIKNGSFSVSGQIETRSTMTITIEDPIGTPSFQPRQPVVLSDSVQGILFSGYVSTSKPNRVAPSTAGASPTIEHIVTVINNHYRADKQANQQNYANAYAGDIALDFWRRALQAEGVVANAAIRRDATVADFNQGILSGTVATSNVGDGDLELVKAGSDITITESTTASFAAGTLTNVVAANNTLTPTTYSAIRYQSNLLFALAGQDYIYTQIWSGNMTIGTLDTFHYDVFIPSTSKQYTSGVDFICSDGTLLRSVANVVDQNGLNAAPTTDLSAYAKDQWYSRTISLTSALNGKTINTILLDMTGSTVGVSTAFFKNIYLGSQSGSPFFATNATTTQLNPPAVQYANGFAPAQTSTTVVTVFDPAVSSRVSPTYSIDAVKLLRSSLLSWVTTGSSSAVNISISYDGGSVYTPAINGSPLPVLPAGSNVASGSIILKEAFGGGISDPTLIPSLQSVVITLQSAANATKSDIVTSFVTQANWNTGTFTNAQALTNGDVTLASQSRNWNDNTISNQTFSTSVGGFSESASSGAYVISSPSNSSGLTYIAVSRLNFAGIIADFTLDIDVKLNSSSLNWKTAGIVYRQPDFGNSYHIVLANGPNIPGTSAVYHGYGASLSFPQTTFTNVSYSPGSTFHIKVVVVGSVHQVYVQGSTTPLFTVNDANYTGPGYFGLIAVNSDTTTGTHTFDNLVITPTSAQGTWQSLPTSIASLVASGGSAIYWTEASTGNIGASLTIQTSVDGGTTFQQCTNGGPIPNIPAGTNLSGKSVIVKALMSTVSQNVPLLRQLAWRVLGVYPGSSGTRTTLPMGMDSMTRANVVSGWGTATDSQTYTQVGTGATALTSNEGLITNTTGDVHMLYGSRTWTDQDGTCRFSLSAATISAGIELRYTDTNNFYRFQASTTTLTLIKRIVGTSYTLATASMTLTTGVFYRMRFRVAGNYPTTASGRVWLDGTLEPTAWNVTFTE